MTALHMPFMVLELEIFAQAQDPITLPEFAGSTLRGCYGAALRRISCMTGMRDCVPCPLRQTCPYPALFESPMVDLQSVGIARAVENGTPPYVILPPLSGLLSLAPGEGFSFSMRIFGQAIQRLAFVIEAWREALNRGLGKSRGRAILSEIWATDPRSGRRLQLYGGDDGEFPDSEVQDLAQGGSALEVFGERLMLEFITPLRLLSQGRPLKGAQITPRRLIAAAIRRARSLTALHGSVEARESLRQWPIDDWLIMSDKIIAHTELSWRDWRRYSARQQQEMILGGVVGRAFWSAVDPGLAFILELACLTFVGKEAVFGFGQIASNSCS